MSASILSIKFVKCYWITMRPYLLFVSGITGISGLSFGKDLHIYETAIMFLVFFFSYGFGQALTDCFQTDTDSISSPYRPIIKGEIDRKDVLIISLILLMVCGIILASFSLINLVYALLCIFGLSTYTYFKKRWWAGPFYNGWIVAVLFLIGYNSVTNNTVEYFSLQIIFAIAAVLFGYANFVLVGYFKDVEADRSTGYITFVVKWGRKNASILSDIFAGLFILFSYLSIYSESSINIISNIASTAFMITAICFSIYTQVKLHYVTKDSDAYKAVSTSVITYILMLSSIASFNKPEWIPFFIIFFLGFLLTIILRPEKTQI